MNRAFKGLLLAVLVIAPAQAGEAPAAGKAADPHAGLFAQDTYPSASQCKKCHERIYREWSLSSHAYAGISPMFHKFEQKINDLSQGTVGTFCVRCHIPVGTALGEKRELSIDKRARVSREGITCVACHRISEEYGLVNGERRMVPGDIYQFVYGNEDPKEVNRVVAEKDAFKVKTSAKEGRGVDMHAGAFKFPQLSSSEFCMGCHQVAVHPGIKLEVVWDQYHASPAAKKGVRCQDCHMGKEPGKANGFDTLAAAKISGQETAPRPHHDHSFFGPGYPIAHPGIFPFSDEDNDYSVEQWLLFDHRAGWGSDDFEAKVADGRIKTQFPPPWDDAISRQDARKNIIAPNLEKIALKKEMRKKVMENGSRIDGPFFDRGPRVGRKLKFHYVVANTDPGHNLPSGSLGAQPEIWLDVALLDPDGKNVWESGYVDSHGDMAGSHSLDVASGKLAADNQLFNLQTKFLTTNVAGTDREMPLPVNFDIDQLPFIRQAPQPASVLNHPPFIRMEQRSIPPESSRKAKFTVPAAALAKPGSYTLAVRLRSRAEPIYFMKFVDATVEMERAMNEWMLDFHTATSKFDVH